MGEGNFEWALEMLKKGFKLARSGWNGKNMWIIMVPGKVNIQMDEGSAYFNAGVKRGNILPHIDMFTATGEMQPGWLASQTDIFAVDWEIVE